jgi:hypothetical protein
VFALVCKAAGSSSPKFIVPRWSKIDPSTARANTIFNAVRASM